MLRVNWETVTILAVCWKKFAVSCIRVPNLTTEIIQLAQFILFESLVRVVSTDASKIGAPQTLEIEDCCVTTLIILDCVTLLRR